MKVVLAAHGTRGDVEPCAAVGLELQRRGHDVHLAVPPDLTGFVDSAGLAAVEYGPNSQKQVNALADLRHSAFVPKNPFEVVRAVKDLFVEGWEQMNKTLTSLADGAELMVTGQTYHGVVANIAEFQDIPVAAVHHFPICVNSQIGFPSIPTPGGLVRSALTAAWWTYWRITQDVDNEQRRELGLPETALPAARRMERRGSLEIQAYDEQCFPGLAAEWHGRRPFVGALTMQLPTDSDDDVASWLAAGTPPIFFGFGSTPIRSPADTIAVIVAACEELGERALIFAADGRDLIAEVDNVKLVGPVNYAVVLPRCRAVVHHGGAGTTAAVMRAGIPALALWDVADQPIWATQITRLKVGRAQRLSTITTRSLVAHLRALLGPQYTSRAREVATRMTTAAESVTVAADLLEDAARVGPRSIR